MIVTRRLILRPFTPEDVPMIARLANDKTLARFVARVRYPYSGFEARKFVMSVLSRQPFPPGTGPRAIALRSNPRKLIGLVGLRKIREGEYRLGYWMDRRFRRKGYVNEAARSLVNQAFDAKTAVISATVMLENDASERVLRRLGMTRCGTEYGFSIFYGRKMPLIRYRITREKWLSRQQ